MNKNKNTIYHNLSKLKNYKYKSNMSIAGSMFISFLGSTLIQNLCNLDDTKETKIIKTGIVSVFSVEIVLYVLDAILQNKYSKPAVKLIYSILANNEIDECHDSFYYSNKIYEYIKTGILNMEKLDEGWRYYFIFDNKVIIEEIINNEYSCKYIDNNTEYNLTKKAKKILKRM